MSGKVKQWVVGSSPSCNLLVSVPTVSSKHCRLTRQDATLQIEDVGSTNGTYVDGVKIDSATTVNPASRVTLGAMIPLPWPEAETAERVIRIGRADDNDFVIDAANISTYHARLIVGPAGTLVVEDLASTNGTWILPGSGLEGAPTVPAEPELQRILRCASVGLEDQIYLGSTPVNVSDVVSSGAPRIIVPRTPPNETIAPSSENYAPAPLPVSKTIAPSFEGPDFGSIRSQLQTSEISGDETSPLPGGRNFSFVAPPKPSFPYRRTMLVLACCVAATITLLGISAAIKKLPFWRQPAAAGSSEPEQPPSTDSLLAITEPSTASLPDATNSAPVNSVPVISTLSSVPSVKPEVPSSPFESLHWVLVSQGTPKKFFRVGTAWSPDGAVLLTSTGVLVAMQTLKEAAGAEGEIQVVHAASGRVHKVLSWGSSSEFERQIAKFSATDKAIKAKMAPYRNPQEKNEDVDVTQNISDETRAEIQKLQAKMLDEKQAAACYDVGWIRIEPPTMAPMLLMNRKVELRPNQKLRIVSALVDIQDPFFDEASLYEPQWIDCRVKAVVTPPGVSNSRLIADCDFVVDEFNLFGSPIVNEKNEVVAMFIDTSDSEAAMPMPSKSETAIYQIDGVRAASMVELLEEIEKP